MSALAMPHRMGPVGGGPDLIAAARSLVAKCGKWPYPWVYPPENANPWFVGASVKGLAYTVETQVVSYQVPEGFCGVLAAIMNLFTDNAYVDGAGMVTWGIDVNQPAGSTFPIGRPVEYFGSIVNRMGSLDGFLLLPCAVRLRGSDTVRYKVTTNNTVNQITGASTCWLFGWTYPQEDDVN